MFAFVIDHYQFRLKRVIEGVCVSPLLIPHFTVGLGFLILAAQIGWSRGFAVVVACHVVLVLPFVLRSVYVSLRNLDSGYELAAASLGATPLRVLLTITCRCCCRAWSAAGCLPRFSRSMNSRRRFCDLAADADLAGRDVQLRP